MTEKKKILFIMTNLILGGIEKVCWEIVSHLDKSKYQVDILIPVEENTGYYFEPLFLEIGCKIYKCDYSDTKEGRKKFFAYERELIRQNHYDIVHSHVHFRGAPALRAAKQEGVKTRISHVHFTYPYKNEWNMQRKIIYTVKKLLLSHYANVKIGCGEKAAKDHYFGKYQVIYNGMDTQKLLQLPTDKKDDKCLVVIGRLSGEKNPLFICDLMRELVKLDRAYHLEWVGDGDMRPIVEEKIREYGLKKNIHLVGSTPDIFPYLEQARFGLLPSQFEGFGIAAMETQLAHCYTFCSDVIPKETDIGRCMYLPLQDGAQKWACVIDDFAKHGKDAGCVLNREKYSQFDNGDVLRQIEKIYQRSAG